MFNQRFLYAALTSPLALLFHINALAQFRRRGGCDRRRQTFRRRL